MSRRRRRDGKSQQEGVMTAKRVTHGRCDRFRDERGISLIQVALLLFVFMGFSMFVVDYGVLWLARVQAQNAADSGALAGATARAFDELTDPPAVNGAAYQSAYAAARTHRVLGELASPNVLFVCPAFVPPTARCTRVDVYRDGSNGSTTLPTYFAAAFGNFSQQIKATATAWATNGNSTNCMRPWAVADKWLEQVNPNNEFNHWVKQGNNLVELNPHDSYIPPPDANHPNDPFTGYRVSPPGSIPPGDQGTQVILKVGSAGQSISPGWFMAVDLPDGLGGYPAGANDYRANIGSCVGVAVSLGDKLPTETGNMVGPTRQGVLDLVALDPGAYWNSGEIAGSCAPATCGSLSPRIVPIAIFDPDDYQKRSITNDWSGCPGGGGCVTVINILGFFVAGMQGNDVIGYLLTVPAEFLSGKGTVSSAASFAPVIQLIQ